MSLEYMIRNNTNALTEQSRRDKMAEFELTPEMVREETKDFADDVQTSITGVQEAAAAISEMPIIDLETEEKPVVNSLDKFTPEERRQIEAVADKIDIRDSNAVLSYGASAQRKVSDFADGALASVRDKDMGETGQVLTSLIVELKHNGEEKQGVLSKLFGNAEKNFEQHNRG